MKQKYVKPDFSVEHFGHTQSIASGCGVGAANTLGKPVQWAKSVCAWDVGGILFFLDGMNVCADIQVKEDEDVYGVCYSNPDGAMIFSSY